ncbi:hypothetical protein [Bradymonas sediminis]|uniref:Uncharacterized protein n=1 Tax=Bradymonas sediminis TaxID=1548548 RepID=A0A2Z4FJ94_9DELT|nr:hypothetical protein [Bradymonas sediminis]AWV88784.1 hypothetical protein DN745_05295 [Bradymonas sediminis]TDP61782.1 hypothetical protein DFR33_11621 [Bradymonas sediminis]
MKLRALVILAVFCAGCFHTSAQSRLGDITPQGRLSGGVQLDVASLAYGDVDGETQWWGARSHPQFLMAMMGSLLFVTQGFLSVGLGDDVEVGARLGIQELAGELRYGLTQQRLNAADGVSTALSLSAGWRPFMVDNFPSLQAGLDISRRYDTLAPHLNIYLTYGPQYQAASADHGASRHQRSIYPAQYGAARRELRLQTVVGVTLLTRDADTWEHLPNGDTRITSKGAYDGNTFDIGIAPWFTLASEPIEGCLMDDCSTFMPWAGEVPEYGAHLLLRYQYFPYRDFQ